MSACLGGRKCRYDGSDNEDVRIVEMVENGDAVIFCPEEYCYGTPRPTMDLFLLDGDIRALREGDLRDLTPCIVKYAKRFFDKYPDIEIVVGKDRSPSCGVKSAKLYDREGELLSSMHDGIFIKEAKKRDIECFGIESFKTEL